MPQNDMPERSYARSAPREEDSLPLFRKEALQEAREPLHGTVSVLMPPSAALAAVTGFIALALLALAAIVVEIPQRTRAVGVLMPPQGFLKIVAVEPGQVLHIAVAEGERVGEGQPLLNIGSDRSAADRGPLSASQIRSLQQERSLLDQANGERQRLQSHRMRAVDYEINDVDRRLALLAVEIDIQSARRALLQSRFDRLERLAAEGNISTAQLDDGKLELLQAQSAAAVLQRQATQIAQERRQLREKRASLIEESKLQQIEFAITSEQLQRQVATLEAVVNHNLQAPESGVIARINVRPGQFVRAGQTLVTLHASDAVLQAWLYLPSTGAGLLQTGQEVDLRLDAYPHQVFGTQPATIASISNIAFLPTELDVPLVLSGPVFEVRATLNRQHVRAKGRDWPLSAGTSVKADLVQERYRLFEWLLKLRRRDGGSSGSPVDA
jgi:membrane fusion protein